MTEKEIRKLDTNFEVRANDDGEEYITGYALKFNRWSEVLMGSFKETIEPTALRNTDMDNVVALFNHDENQILGRSGVNLDLEIDDIGLKFKVKPTDTSYSKDLMANIRSGLINQCSFAMSDIESEWDDVGENEPLQRKITNIGHLWDVSVVTTPAYPDTEAVVGARSKEKVNEIINNRHKDDGRKNEIRKKLIESYIN